jgi:signal peptidase I
MEPTLRVGDHLLVNKAAYGLRIPLSHWWLTHSQPTRGDVVVFEHPLSGTVMVKRVVGLPGDQLSFDGEHLFINGVAVDQRIGGDSEQTELLPGRVHALYPGRNQGPPLAPMTIPANSYFMMGDHRGNSFDSRSWGLVPRDLLLGRAVSVIYSSRSGLSWGQRWWISLGGDESNFDDRLSK